MSKSMKINLRRRRADALVAAVLDEMRRRSEGPLNMDDVCSALRAVFMREGVYVMTDNDRQEMKLPPRGADGWTEEETMAYERRLLEALKAQPVVLVKHPAPPATEP